MTREDAIKTLRELWRESNDSWYENVYNMAIEALSAEAEEYEDYEHATLVDIKAPLRASAEAVHRWIPCSERLPSELEAVTVTWVNHNPPVYYQHIKDVPEADTAVYYRGAWYWWDATVIDLLGEYDDAYIHGIEPIDKDIEVTAWMPLPEPYKGGDSE